MTEIDTTPQPTAPDRDGVPRYEPTVIEPHWQQQWADTHLYRTNLYDSSKRKFYLLTMYPYPSGDLHIGHWYIKTPTDAIARFRRMNGDNVFFPIGFDAFGLPAENAAIKSGVHPGAMDDAQHRAHARPAPEHGRDVRLGERGHHLPARVLPLEPVDLPAAAQVGPGVSQDGRRRLVSQGPGRAGPGAGRRPRPGLLALRHPGHQA